MPLGISYPSSCGGCVAALSLSFIVHHTDIVTRNEQMTMSIYTHLFPFFSFLLPGGGWVGHIVGSGAGRGVFGAAGAATYLTTIRRGVQGGRCPGRGGFKRAGGNNGLPAPRFRAIA